MPPAVLRIQFPGRAREIDAHDSSLVTKAIEDWRAKLGYITFCNPGSDTHVAHAASRAKVPLLLRSQSGNVIVFGFPVVEDEISPGTLPGAVSGRTVVVQAARELVTVLPALRGG